MKSFFEYISKYPYYHFYLIPLLFSAIFSLKSFGLKWPKPYRIFSLFLILTFVTEIFAILWGQYLHKVFSQPYPNNNLWIYNGSYLIRYSLLLLFYYKMLNSAGIKKVLQFVGFGIIVFGVLEFTIIQSPDVMNQYTLILSNTFGILITLLYFRQILRDPRVISLVRSPVFWITLATFVYCAGCLPYFIFFNLAVQKSIDLALVLLKILSALNIFLYTFYLIAFLCRPK
jgi:hypothetical protein